MSDGIDLRAKMRAMIIDKGVPPAKADEIVDLGFKASSGAIDAAFRTLDLASDASVKLAAMGVAFSHLGATVRHGQDMVREQGEKLGSVIIEGTVEADAA